MRLPITIVSPTFMKFINIINAGIIDTRAITLFPFVISREPMNETTTRHETIHIYQQMEMFVIFFYLLYGWDYLVGWFKYRNMTEAYYNIRFEQEAYDNHSDPNYITNRQLFAWTDYTV